MLYLSICMDVCVYFPGLLYVYVFACMYICMYVCGAVVTHRRSFHRQANLPTANLPICLVLVNLTETRFYRLVCFRVILLTETNLPTAHNASISDKLSDRLSSPTDWGYNKLAKSGLRLALAPLV